MGAIEDEHRLCQDTENISAAREGFSTGDRQAPGHIPELCFLDRAWRKKQYFLALGVLILDLCAQLDTAKEDEANELA